MPACCAGSLQVGQELPLGPDVGSGVGQELQEPGLAFKKISSDFIPAILRGSSSLH